MMVCVCVEGGEGAAGTGADAEDLRFSVRRVRLPLKQL